MQDESSMLDDILMMVARLEPLSAQSKLGGAPSSAIPQQTRLQLVNAIAGVLSGGLPARIVDHALGWLRWSNLTGASDSVPPGDNTVPPVSNSPNSLPIPLLPGRLASVLGRTSPLHEVSIDGSERSITSSPLPPTALQAAQRPVYLFPVLHSTRHHFLAVDSLDSPQPQAPRSETSPPGMPAREFSNYMYMQTAEGTQQRQGNTSPLPPSPSQLSGEAVANESQNHPRNGEAARTGGLPQEAGVDRQDLVTTRVFPNSAKPSDIHDHSENMAVDALEKEWADSRGAASREKDHEPDSTVEATATTASRVRQDSYRKRANEHVVSSSVRTENAKGRPLGSAGPRLREDVTEERVNDFALTQSAAKRDNELPIDGAASGQGGSVRGERLEATGLLSENDGAVPNDGQEEANTSDDIENYTREEQHTRDHEESDPSDEHDPRDYGEEEPLDEEELEEPYGGWDDPADSDLGSPDEEDAGSSYDYLVPSVAELIFKFFPLPEWLTLSPDQVPSFDWKRVFKDYFPGATKLSHAINMADDVIYNEYCNRTVLEGEPSIDAPFEFTGDVVFDEDLDDALFPPSFGENRRLPLVPMEIEDEFDKCVNFYKNRTRDYIEEYRQQCDDLWDDPKAPGGSRLRPLTIDDMTTCFLRKYDVGRRWFNELFFQPWFHLLNQTSYLSQAVDTAMAEFAYNGWLFPAAYAAANFGVWRACIETRDCFDGEQCVPALPAIYGFVLSFCQRTADSMTRDPITGVPLAERFVDVGIDRLPIVSSRTFGSRNVSIVRPR
nr:TPA: hypothetical protein BN1204_058520 [Neospora caninum Liverpool]